MLRPSERVFLPRLPVSFGVPHGLDYDSSHLGFFVSVAIVALFILTGIWLLQKRDARRARRLAEGGIDEESTSAHDVVSLKESSEKDGLATVPVVVEVPEEKRN